MKVITYEDIKRINEVYKECKTYAATARKTGFSPATVKKYVRKDYEVINEENIVRFNRPLPEFDSTMFRVSDWGPLCELGQDEVKEIKDLWKEIEV